MTNDLPRRRFIQIASGVGAVVAPFSTRAAPSPGPSAQGADPARSYLFFNSEEAAFVEAAAGRMVPDEPGSPGALQADVPWYIDRQLAGAWGNGLQLYAQGPFKKGTPSQGYQLPFTPAQIYRLGIQAISKSLAPQRFSQLSAPAQDDLLSRMDRGELVTEPVPASLFVATLWQNVQEGFFCDPAYGGNRGMVGWKLVGFPGAHAAYVDWVDQHNVPFRKAPVSMSQQSGHGSQHQRHEPQRAPTVPQTQTQTQTRGEQANRPARKDQDQQRMPVTPRKDRDR